MYRYGLTNAYLKLYYFFKWPVYFFICPTIVRMKILSFLWLFAFIFPNAWANSELELPLTKHWVKNIFPQSLPHELRALWNYNYTQKNAPGRIYFFESKNKFCAYLGKDRAIRVLPGKTHRTLRININCLNSADTDDIQEEKNSNSPSPFKKDLIEAAVTQWGLWERPLYQSLPLKNTIFENDFFDTPWSLGVDIDGPHFQIDFYSKALYHYFSDKDLWHKEPHLYNFIRANLYQKEFFYSTYDASTKKYHPHFEAALFNKKKDYAKADIMYLRENNRALWARYDLIQRAQKSITISYFTFFNQISGNGLLGLLLKKLKSGVRVRILLDVRGTKFNLRSDRMQELVAAGAEIKAYNPIFATSTFFSRIKESGFLKGIVSSMHDKILLVDNKWLITGGRNIGDKYFTQHGEFKGRVFSDLDILVKFDRYPTSVIKAFTYEFYNKHASSVREDLLGNWVSRENELYGAMFALHDRFYNQVLHPYTVQNYPILLKYPSLYGMKDYSLKWDAQQVPVVGIDNTSSFGKLQQITNTIIPLIKNSKEVYIQNPYLVLTPEMGEALKYASERGSKIIISVTSPLSTDSWATQAFLVNDWKKIMAAIPGIEIHAFLGPTQLHSKLFVIDRRYSIIGSYNMDFMSQNVNSEFSLLIDSTDFASVVLKDVGTFINGNSFSYDHKKNIGPLNIPNVKDAYHRTMKFFWAYKPFKNII